MHRVKTLNTEQEVNIKSLNDEVARKASVVEEKEASISRLNSKVHDMEHRNSDLMSKVEDLIEEKNSGVSNKMDSANKAQEFLESLNEAERKNNALLLENAELKVKVKVFEDEWTVAKNKCERRQHQLECELLVMRDLKSVFQHKMENAIAELKKCQQEFSEKEKHWLQSEEDLSKKLSDLETREAETCEVSEKLRLDNTEFQSRLSRKDTVIEKQEQTVADLKYEIHDLTKRLENLDTLKDEKELELSRALQASQGLNSEIKIEIEQLKLELQEREGSVERELGNYNEKLRVLEEEKAMLQTRLDTTDKKRVEKQNLDMKPSDLETDKSNIGGQVKEFQERMTHMEQKLETAEKALLEKQDLEKSLKDTIQELVEKLSHPELNLSSSESELDQHKRSSSDLEETVSHLQTKVQDMVSKLDASEWMTHEHGEEMVHLQTSLVQAEERACSLTEEVEGLRSLVMLLDHQNLEISQVKVS